MSYFVELLVNFREKGFPEVIEEICDAMNAKNVELEKEKNGLNARIDAVEEEKAEELSSSLLEKIPECPVNNNLFQCSNAGCYCRVFLLFQHFFSLRQFIGVSD